MLRIIGTIGKIFLLTLILIWGFSVGFHMMSKDDTFVAIGGLLLIGLFGLIVVASVPAGYQALRRDWKIYRSKFMQPLLVLLMIMLSGCAACTRIAPGHVGIQVELAGSQRGVSDFPLKTGWVFYNPMTEQVFEWPTFVQTAVWTQNPNEGKRLNEEITFTTADQMQVHADISLAYHLEANRVPAFYVKFRNSDMDQFTHGFLRNLAREKFDNVAGKYKIEQIMGDNAIFLKEVRDDLQKEVASIGVVFDQFGFIGAPRPPQQVIDAINAKVRAVQIAIQIENEIRQSEATAKKAVAQAEGEAKAVMVKAKAEADANELISRSLTPALVQYTLIQRWDGKRPTVEGGSGVLLQLPGAK